MITILYFSGTGNTKKVVEYLASNMTGDHKEVVLLPIDEVAFELLVSHINKSDMVGIAFPVYGLDCAPNMVEFVKKVPSFKNKEVFLLLTCAESVILNTQASYKVKNIIRNKGGYVFYERMIAMGSNWLVEYDWDIVRLLDQAAKSKANHMSQEIASRKRRLFKDRKVFRVGVTILAFFEHHFGARFFGATLYATDDCTRCGLCANQCPMNNIRIVNGEVKSGLDCIWCMRCVYNCKPKALKSWLMGFVVHKKGYVLEEILEDQQEQTDIGFKSLRKRLKPYLEDERK